MESIKKLFETTDLFSILNITEEKATDPKALKAAYFKAALATHPDKGTEDEREIRTQKFQVVTKIYELLQDEDLKKSYIETGEWPDKEECNIDLSSFGRRLDETDILEFKKIYLGSEEERQDVKRLYEESSGNIIHIMENLFYANILDDKERVEGIIEDLITKGDMKKLTKGLVSEKAVEKKILKAKKEAKEAEEARKELNLDGGIDSLRVALAKNGAKRASFLDDLEKKYSSASSAGNAGKKGKGKGKATIKPEKTKNGGEHEETPKAKKPKKAAAEPSGRVTRSSKN